MAMFTSARLSAAVVASLVLSVTPAAEPAVAQTPVPQEVVAGAGETFFGLSCRPADARLDVLLAAAGLPAGADATDSALLQIYASAAQPETVYRRDASGRWVDGAGAAAGEVALVPGAGYALVLPAGSAPVTLSWTGDVIVAEMHAAIRGRDGETNYAVLAWPRNKPITVRELGLRESGLAGGRNPSQADEIRVLDNEGGMGSRKAPKARIWLNDATGGFEHSPPDGGSAEAFVIGPGEAFIVVRKRGPSLSWPVPQAP
jgi:hypothetical protein